LKHILLLPPLITLFVKVSGAVAAAHIICREPFKALIAVWITLFPVLFVNPRRIDPEVCHDPHLNAKLNRNTNNATRFVLKSIHMWWGYCGAQVQTLVLWRQWRINTQPHLGDSVDPRAQKKIISKAETRDRMKCRK
jgi:hypothetical protein